MHLGFRLGGDNTCCAAAEPLIRINFPGTLSVGRDWSKPMLKVKPEAGQTAKRKLPIGIQTFRKIIRR